VRCDLFQKLADLLIHFILDSGMAANITGIYLTISHILNKGSVYAYKLLVLQDDSKILEYKLFSKTAF
jgi:hypothetical protein